MDSLDSCVSSSPRIPDGVCACMQKAQLTYTNETSVAMGSYLATDQMSNIRSPSKVKVTVRLRNMAAEGRRYAKTFGF